MSTLFETATIRRDAELSDCGRYRYSLTRVWDESLPQVCWIMLNPSTADAEKDDPTIRKCVGFSKRWGAGGLVVVNLFAWRATKPADVLKASAPIGPFNDRAIRRYAQDRRLVAAWGANAQVIGERDTAVCELLGAEAIDCLRLTDNGYPWHPLYVPYDVEPIPYRG
jgi:hypothetical protein